LFHSDNNEEIGFADAYKSQILNPEDEDDTSKNLIIILLLIAIIIGLSVFGYIYITKTVQTEKQENVKEIKAIEEVSEEIEPPKSQMLNNIDELEENIEPMDIEGIDMPEDVKNIKIEDKPKLKETKHKEEETYLEQLADLSKEIDGETKKK